ncbi:RICIN domain-containing protein [Actinoplanes sp. NPDC023801]|uniref:RICIN domain-containing protein n=1 Tax=Actinoplanes sp. NPDC023801 TaxID=3154595 RepID=UPI0033FDA314
MGEDLGDNREPLLVRPFVLPDGDRQEPRPSASTWPVEQTAGELPTQLLPVVPAAESTGSDEPSARWRRRPLLLAGAGVAAVALVAGYAWLRPDDRAENWTSPPAQSLPAAIGPATSSGVAPSGLPADGQGNGDDDAGDPTRTSPSPRVTPSSAGSPSTVGTSAGASAGVTGSPAPAAPAPPAQLLPDAVETGQGLLVTGNGLCLDLRGGEAGEGRDVHIDDCNGTSPQRWQLNADRTLEVLDMCAYVVGDGTVDLTGCDGRTTAQWQLFGNGTLTNSANGMCLTDPHSGARPGNSVTVAFCAGGNNQRWFFR